MSSDPAMEEYIPLSPEHKNAQEYNQNLPGLGSIYNSRNLQVYHYGGNNPLKYTDPTGERAYTNEEIQFIYEVLGVKGLQATTRSGIEKNPFSDDRSASIPVGSIKMPGSLGLAGVSIATFGLLLMATYKESYMENEEDAGELVHEVFHQVQYGTNSYQRKAILAMFIVEQGLNELGENPYEYDIININKLSDIKKLEGRGQFMQDFATLYYKLTRGEGLTNAEKEQFEKMQQIMQNSGYDTIASRIKVGDDGRPQE